MYPILFTIGPVKVYSFGAMVAVGFLVSLVWLRSTCRRKGLESALTVDLAFGLFVSALLGSRLLFICLNLSWYRSHPLEIVQLQKGGLVAYGGLFLAILFALFFTRWKGISFWDCVDLIAPFWMLSQAFGRIGCFLNGCCYGKPNSLFGIHPTQLYESLGLFLLFWSLRVADRRSLKRGHLFALALGGYGFLRFGVEFFRGDQFPFLAGLTLAQWMSLMAVAVAAWIWLRRQS